MADVDFEILGKPGTISATVLRVAVQQTVGLLHEYDSVFSGKQSGIYDWTVRELRSNGSLKLGFSSQLIPRKRKEAPQDISSRVTTSLVTGIETVKKETIPPFLSEHGLARIETLADLVWRKKAEGFRMTAEKRSTLVTDQMAESLERMLKIKRSAYGSVEGRLVGISIAKGLVVSVIHHLTNKSIRCELREDQEGLAKDYLGKRVMAIGILRKNNAGDTIRAQVNEFKLIEKGAMRAELADISRLPSPSFSSIPTTEDYLKTTRGE